MTSQRRWWTFAVVCLALFMAMLDNLVVLTALPAIKKALGSSVSDLEWTVSAYTLAFAVLMIMGAGLGDRFGRKRIFLLGVGIFTVGSAAAALSGSATALTMARGLQGVGAAFLTPLTLTILTRVFPAHQRAAAIGLWSGVSGLGLAIGPLIGGAIVSGVTWNAIFWLNVPVGLGVIALGWLRLDESYGERQPLDLPGVAMAGLGLLGITFGLIRGNALGWTSTTVLSSLIVGMVLVVAFIAYEWRARHPMLDLRLFQARGFSVANGVGFLMSAGMFGSIFLITLFVQQVQGYSPFQAGLRTMPWTGTIMLIAPIAGLLAGRIGPRFVVITGMFLQAGALLWLGIIAEATTPYASILPAFIMGGVGMGLTFAPLSESVMAAVRGIRQGQASGAYNAIRELGGVFGVAMLGAVFQHIATTPAGFVNGFHTALIAGSGIVGAGAISAWLLPRVVAEQSSSVSTEPVVVESFAAE